MLSLSSSLYFLPETRASLAITVSLNSLIRVTQLPELSEPYAFGFALSFIMFAVGLVTNLWLHHLEVSRALTNLNRQGLLHLHRDFENSLKRYCKSLIASLDRYDNEVNWSDHELTMLEAEVETERIGNLRPKLTRNLIAAIRRDRQSSVFVVLGDPGSGKSVSLRRLVRVLCKQSIRTGIVPIYVNLREYPPNEEPSPESLLYFVRETALYQTGRDGRSFLDTWYEIFRRSGRLFFVIDSFDELPAVLDCDEKSDQHKRISSSFDRFFSQEVLSCRAVLASRYFRAPVEVKGTRLFVRPFTEMKIRRAMRSWLRGKGLDSRNYVRRLFLERPHLVPLLRNPFSGDLIAEYALSGGADRLPLNLYAVFDHYLTQRLETDKSKLERLGLSATDVRQGAGMIAVQMYESLTGGLEADVDEIIRLLEAPYKQKAKPVIDALHFSRLVRLGGNYPHRFSFVHRRFAEFFVVDVLRHDAEFVNVEAIPTDSRWRDCLVMYCGIVDLPSRIRIANYCWSVIESSATALKSGQIPEARGAIHCIRFLADAFRSDLEPLQGFRDRLGEFSLELLKREDPLVAKIAAESIPLLSSSHQQEAIVRAFESGSKWVCDTTLNSCRHIGKIDRTTSMTLRRYFASFTLIELLQRFRDLDFTLGLSDSFRRQQYALRADVVEGGFIVTACLTFSILAALNLPVVLGIAAVAGICYWGLRNSQKEHFFLDGLITQRRRDPFFACLRWFTATVPLVFLSGVAIVTMSPSTSRVARFLLSAGFTPQPIHFGTVTIGLLSVSVASIGWETVKELLEKAQDSIKVLLAGLTQKRPRDQFKEIVMISSVPQWTKVWHNLKEVVAGVIGIMLFVLFTALVSVAGHLIWQLIPLPIRHTLNDISYLTLLGAIAALTVLLLISRAIAFYGAASVNLMLDRKRMSQLGVPYEISCAEVLQNLRSFRSSKGRREYLELLRIKRVRLIGSASVQPKFVVRSTHAIDMQLAEEFARLREQWYGLTN